MNSWGGGGGVCVFVWFLCVAKYKEYQVSAIAEMIPV